MMVAKMGATEGAASGEVLERNRRRRKFWIIGTLFVAGFVGGFTAGFTQADDLLDPNHFWPPALAISLAAAFLVVVIVGAIFYGRHLDEFEKAAKQKSVVAAAGAYVLVYPVWLLLWKGGLVREPMHFVIFIGFVAVMGLAKLFHRVR
ncbi:MAG TPA: hypothetical protein VEC11_16130 [Allosphingosinicella sp.]|nr:hypothetical protein [Allosphingosinicella sp.]